MKHELKILPEWYETLLSGEKTFEVRKDDREPKFQPRDELFLREFDGTKYTGRTITATVTLVLRNEYCKEGYCIMSVVIIDSTPPKPKTNFDRIKSMSVEEMAEFIDKNYKCRKCYYYGRCNGDCHGGIKKWLKSEVQEDEEIYDEHI